MKAEYGKRTSVPAVVLVAAVGLLTLSGCGDDGIPRVPVSGTVTLDDKPLAQGAILFQPTGGGPSAGGTIVEGEFTIPGDRGPSPGTYLVEVRSYQGTGKKIPDPDFPGKMEEQTRNVVPRRYNEQTTLRQEVSAEGTNRFEFRLESR